MIRAVRICITPGSPAGRYSVSEEYPTMRDLYTGDDLEKVIESLQTDEAEPEDAETDKAESAYAASSEARSGSRITPPPHWRLQAVVDAAADPIEVRCHKLSENVTCGKSYRQ